MVTLGLPARLEARFAGVLAARPTRRPPLPRRAVVTTACLLLAVPLLVAAASVAARRYVPMGDEAATLFRAQQVGSSQTPLVGVYSSHGWAHPGPFLFYMLAVPLRLTGGSTRAPFVFAGVCNALLVVLICALAWRRRRWLGLALVGFVVALLLHGLGMDMLVRIWNPYIPLLIYFAFLLAMWGVAEQDRRLQPLAAALGSAVVQLHVGYLPLVALAAASTGLHRYWMRRHGRAQADGGPSSRRLTLLVLLLFWLPVVFDLAFGSRNALRLVTYFASSHGPVAGLRTGVALMNSHLGLAGSWVTGKEPARFHPGAAGVPWQLLGLAGLLGCLLWLQLRKPGRGAALPSLALGQLVAGTLAAGKVEVPINSYLVVWLLPLAAFCWAAVGLAAADVVARHIQPGRIFAGAIAASVLVAALCVTATEAVAAGRTPLPQQQYATAVASVLRQMHGRIDANAPIRIEVLDGAGGRPGDGVLYGIGQLDQRFYTSDGEAGQKWGSEHRWHFQRTAYTLTIVATDSAPLDPTTRKCLADGHQPQMANWTSPQTLKGALRLTVFRGTHVCGG